MGNSGSPSSESNEKNILNQIVSVFKKGEIDLPSPPHLSIKFKELVAQKASLEKIGDLLSKDMAISSKLISVSNSAYYRGVTENKNLTQAVSRLGVDTTQQYVDAILNRTLYITKNKEFAGYIEKLWEHSLSCAYAAQAIQESLRLNLKEDVFTLALFHDIGKLIIFKIIAELQLKKKLDDTVETFEVLEAVNNFHAKFGASLLKLWKFSGEYLRVASYHDNLEGADETSEELLVVHFANYLVKSMGFGQVENSDVDLSSLESASSLNLDEVKIAALKEKVKLMMDELAGLLK